MACRLSKSDAINHRHGDFNLLLIKRICENGRPAVHRIENDEFNEDVEKDNGYNPYLK